MKALITGGSGGIGLEIARQFAKNNIDVVLVAREEDALKSAAAELEKEYHVAATTIVKDLSVRNAAEEVYQAIQQDGLVIDYLVNDAGFGNFGLFAETDWKKEESMIALNVVALTELCKLFIPGMVARKHGKILNLASTAAFQPGPLMAVYYATKAYVLSFSEAINNELHGTGVTVTALCPGPTRTGFEKAANANGSRLFKRDLPTASDVAKYGYQALMEGKSVAIQGFRNNILAFAVKFFPRDTVTAMSRRAAEK